MITPEARGPDQSYEGLAAADVFEVWAAVARMYRLDPAYADITGYSMGGVGTFKLAEQFPICSRRRSRPSAPRRSTMTSRRPCATCPS